MTVRVNISGLRRALDIVEGIDRRIGLAVLATIQCLAAPGLRCVPLIKPMPRAYSGFPV